MTAENPLNALELAEESTAGPVNRASSQMSTLVRGITLARMELAQRGPMPPPMSRPMSRP